MLRYTESSKTIIVLYEEPSKTILVLYKDTCTIAKLNFFYTKVLELWRNCKPTKENQTETTETAAVHHTLPRGALIYGCP